MKLKRVLLENVCQFPHLDHRFHPGLTGIIGPNGSGKSNLTKALYFALTGVFRNAGVKADNVAQLGQGRRSAVTLDFEHDGVDLTVVRGLARVPTTLTAAGDPEPVTGDVAVTARIMETLGVDAKLLGDYVFILQLHMADFIAAPPGDRAKVFQRLFGAERFEAVHAFMTRVVDRELHPAEVADVAPIRARLEASVGRMDALLDRLERLDADVVTAEARAPAARQLVADDEWVRWADDELTLIDRRAGYLRDDVEHYAQVRDRAAAELATLEAALEAAARDAEQARVALATWQAVEARRARVEVLARRRQRLERDAAEHPQPGVPARPAPGDAAELRSLLARQGQLERRIELARTGVSECPTCGQPVVPGNVDESLGELGLVAARVATLTAVQEAYDGYNEACARWWEWDSTHARRMADLQADEQALGEEPAVPVGDQAGFRRAVDHEKGLRDAIARLRERQAQAAQEFAQARGNLDGLHAQRHALEGDRARRVVPAGVFAAAQADLIRLVDLRTDRARVEGEAAELGRAIDADEALARRLEESLARAAAVRQLRAGAEQVVAVTHRNAAPRLIAEAYLEDLSDDVVDFLDTFGADFSVRLGKDLGFVADFADGRTQAAGRLSEGQKGVLALAFWVAVNSLFAGKIGFLSLDEPTASLDQHSLGALEVALDRLRGLSESTGLQCLLVTHEPSLAGLFDDVLPL